MNKEIMLIKGAAKRGVIVAHLSVEEGHEITLDEIDNWALTHIKLGFRLTDAFYDFRNEK